MLNVQVVHSGRPSLGRIDSALRGEWGFDVIEKIEQVVQVRNWVTSTPRPSGMAMVTPVQPARASSLPTLDPARKSNYQTLENMGNCGVYF